MSLTDGHVAALADQAAAAVEPSLTVHIEPDAGDDPYRWGAHSWTVTFRSEDGEGVAVRLTADEEPLPALRKLLEAVSELGATQPSSGRALPACPGHDHRADVEIEEDEVVLRCPETGDVIGRIRPELSP